MRQQPKTMAVAAEWVEAHCVVPDGFRKGDPFRLYDYQLLYLANFYLVRTAAEWDPINPILAPAFVHRRGLLIGPQKVGKNPMIAAQVCIEGVGPALFAGWAKKGDGWSCAEHGCGCGWEYPYEAGEPMGMAWPTPLIQITAFSEESTENTYDALRPMIDNGPLSDLIPKTGEEFIRLPGGGRIDTVTSSALSRLGQRVTFCPQDEVGVWTKRNKMTKVADTQWRGLAGMGGRASLTTNGWDPTERSVAQQEYESGAEDVYRQYDRPPKALNYAKKADRQKIHRAVYPKDTLRAHGGHVDLNSIESEAADLAKRDLPQAARFYGNIIMGGQGVAVDPDRWAAISDPGRLVVDHERIGVGFDGSISDDATALVCCTADAHLFIPTVDDKLTVWHRPLSPTTGEPEREWRVPRAEVERAVEAIFAKYDVGRMFCDPPKWTTDIERWADRYNAGKSLEEAIVAMFDTNQPKRMSAACDRYLTLLDLDVGHVTHDGDSVLTAHTLAMVRKKAYVRIEDEDDGRVRYVFTKGDDHGRKIDAGIASVLALEAAMTMPAAPQRRSVYEERGLETVG